MVTTEIIFLFLAGIFLVGFFGNMFFKKTKISDIFFLMLIGFLLGSGLNIIPTQELELLKNFSSFFGSLALVILLFEGGLHLNFYRVVKELGNAASFTLLAFIISVVLSGLLLHLVFSFPIIYGLLIGAIVGGVSSAVIIPLVSNSKAKENTKTLLTLESAITDAFSVIIVVAITEIIAATTASVQSVFQSIFSAFAIATVLGIAGAILWLKILRDFPSTHNFSYLLTLSFLFILYSLIEFVNGNGAFGALVFGLILGNSSEILSILKMKKFYLSKTITMFQAEIALFIKTFFFIFLGIIVEITQLSLQVILIVISMLVFAIISRILTLKLLFKKKTEIYKDKEYVVSLHARGLAAAVLATYPLSVMGIVNQYTKIILPIAFLVIILTNISTTIMFFITEKRKKKKDDSSKDDLQPVKTIKNDLDPIVKEE